MVTFNIGDAINKASQGDRGFIAGFSSTTIADDELIQNLMDNDAYKNLPKDKELICVAVDMQ